MRMMRMLVVGSLILLTGLSPAALAQERHAVAPASLAEAVRQHVAEQDTNRATIREALARPEVAEVATKTGVDLGRLSAALDTMSGDNLERAATAARQVNDRLVGGATVVISTTTIIIGLLILILIIVATN